MKLENTDDDLEKQARAEVAAILGQSVPIRASTLTEAIAEAERLKSDHNILMAINSLWAWFNGLPPEEREDIGTFRSARHFWITTRFRDRLQ